MVPGISPRYVVNQNSAVLDNAFRAVCAGPIKAPRNRGLENPCRAGPPNEEPKLPGLDNISRAAGAGPELEKGLADSLDLSDYSYSYDFPRLSMLGRLSGPRWNLNLHHMFMIQSTTIQRLRRSTSSKSVSTALTTSSGVFH